MVKPTIGRRAFLNLTAATAAGAALASSHAFRPRGLGPARAAVDATEQLIKTSCRMCYGRCGLIAHVRDGKITKIDGWPEAPNNLGRICAKAFAIPQFVYQPQRILYPMKSVGKRGENKFQRISWDEAYSLVATNLNNIRQKYGGISIATARGTGRDFVWGDFFTWFNNSIGSYFSSSAGHNCFVSAGRESASLIGDEFLTRGADIPNSKVIIWWGKNSFGRDHTPAHSRQALDAIARGAKFVEIDPRFTTWASKADLWLPVRPGTDVAILLAMIKYVLDNKNYDVDFVTNWSDAPLLVNTQTKLYMRTGDTPPSFLVWDPATNSAKPLGTAGVTPALFGAFQVGGVTCKTVFQLLSENVAQWTPQKAADLTWVPVDRIQQVCELYAKNSPGACVVCGHKKDTGTNASGFTHALDILVSMTGNVEAKGGNIFTPNMGIRKWGFPNYGLLPGYAPKAPAIPPPKEAAPVTGRFPFSGVTDWQFIQTVLTGQPVPIHALLTQTANPILGLTDAKKMYQAIMKMDFVVTIDWAQTPLTALSDVILPPATPSEVNNMDVSASTPLPCDLGLLISRARMVPPLGESKDDCVILEELAKKMGLSFDIMLPFDTKEAYMDWLLAPSGMTFAQLVEKGFVTKPIEYKRYATGKLRVDGKPGFTSSTGRANMYSEAMIPPRGNGPLPVYVEPSESPVSTPDLAKQYPLICIAGARDPHGMVYFHSEYKNVPWLREIHPYPSLVIHPDTAKSLGIADGDWVWIENKLGRVRMVAMVNKQVRPEVVSADHDGWYPEKSGADPILFGAWDSNINVLTNSDGAFDPATGSQQISGFLCKVYKATEGAPDGIAKVTADRTL